MLEKVAEDDAAEPIRVRLRDCTIKNIGNNLSKITADVPLDRVWERIESVRVYMTTNAEPTILPTSTANILRIRFNAHIGEHTRFLVYVNDEVD